MSCRFLLQGIFLTQEWNPCLLQWQVDSLPLCHLESPIHTGKALLKAVSGRVGVAQNACCYSLGPSYHTACGLLSHDTAALETLLEGGIQQEIDFHPRRYMYITRTLCLSLHNDNSVDHNLPH